MSPKVDFNIAAGVTTLRSKGDVPLPIEWGNVQETLEMGGYLEPTDSTGTALVADADGHKYLRAGTVLVLNSPNKWRALASVTDTTPADGLADEIIDAGAVGILKEDWDLAQGGGTAGIYIGGGFFGSRMPSVADNATPGLETAVRDALATRGFKFAEDFQ